MRIPVDQLTTIATEILNQAGRNKHAAKKVASRLVAANVTGHDSHGVGMIPAYVEGILSGQLIPTAEIEVVQDKGPFLLVDGRADGHETAPDAHQGRPTEGPARPPPTKQG